MRVPRPRTGDAGRRWRSVGADGVARLHAVARGEQRRLGGFVLGAVELARNADTTVENRNRDRLCDAAHRREPNLRVLAPERTGSDDRGRCRDWKTDLAGGLSDSIRDEQSGLPARPWTQVHTGLRR